MSKIFHKNYFWFLLSFAVCLTVYLLTLCPTIYLEDSSEYATAAATLGISHPSGYPLYILLGKLFTFLPWSNPAFRVNLMSAFFGALSCAFLFLIIQKIFRQKTKNAQEKVEEEKQPFTLLLYYLLPFCSALIFGFSQIFWSQSVVAEVYTLNTFFVAIIIWLLLVWGEKNQEYKKAEKQEKNIIFAQKIKNSTDKTLLLIILLYGLSFANHAMMALLAPFFLVFVLWHDWRVIKDYKIIFAGAFLFIIGISLYLYLPIRASQNPAFNWGNPQSWEGFKNHVLRRQYNDLHFEENKIFNPKKLPLVDGFFQETVNQFTFVGIAIAVIGFLANYFRNKKIFFIIFGTFIGNSLLIIFLRTADYSIVNDYMFRVYYLPAFMMVAVWLAYGLKFILEIFLKIIAKAKRLSKLIILKLIIFVLFILPVSFAFNNYNQNDRSNFWALDWWARNTLLSLDKNAILLVYNDQPALDSMAFSLMYMQAVEKVRNDVILVNTAGIKGMFYMPVGTEVAGLNDAKEQERRDGLVENIAKFAKDQKRTFYILFPIGKQEKNKWVTRSNGFAYRVYENLSLAKKDKTILSSSIIGKTWKYPQLEYNLFFSDFISDYYYAQASYYLETGDKKSSQDTLLEAIKYDASPSSFNYQAFIDHRALWNGENNKK